VHYALGEHPAERPRRSRTDLPPVAPLPEGGQGEGAAIINTAERREYAVRRKSTAGDTERMNAVRLFRDDAVSGKGVAKKATKTNSVARD